MGRVSAHHGAALEEFALSAAKERSVELVRDEDHTLRLLTLHTASMTDGSQHSQLFAIKHQRMRNVIYCKRRLFARSSVADYAERTLIAESYWGGASPEASVVGSTVGASVRAAASVAESSWGGASPEASVVGLMSFATGRVQLQQFSIHLAWNSLSFLELLKLAVANQWSHSIAKLT